MRPSCITTMRSHTAARTARSWLIITRVSSRSRTRPDSTSSTWAWTTTSSAVVGSSAMIRSGSHASAIAIITRCFCPPDSSCGYARPLLGARSTRVRSSSTRVDREPASGRSSDRCSSSASAIWRPHLVHGVERVHRALEDDRRPGPTHGAQTSPRHLGDVLAAERHRSLDACGLGQQPQHRHRQRRLAAAGLAGQADRARRASTSSVTPSTATTSPRYVMRTSRQARAGSGVVIRAPSAWGSARPREPGRPV